ncbi:MAG: sugar O-acetyltransferase [Bacteroidales bacterium]|nr:sugar O-acetyltransferase [Bacteroidales bacterium]
MDKGKAEEYVGSEKLYADIQYTMQQAAYMNSGWRSEEDVRQYLRKITGHDIPDDVRVFTPLHINYGPGVTFGKECFLNFGCTLLAIGGITIGDGVFFGPNCVLATEYHPEEPSKRHQLLTKPIVICRNAWLGANVTVLAGVTIGENAIVAAGSVVTKDIPDNMVAAGTPARIIREIKR